LRSVSDLHDPVFTGLVVPLLCASVVLLGILPRLLGCCVSDSLHVSWIHLLKTGQCLAPRLGGFS